MSNPIPQNSSLSELHKSVGEFMSQFDDAFKPEPYIHNSNGYIGGVKIRCETSGEVLMMLDAYIRYQHENTKDKKYQYRCTLSITKYNFKILPNEFRSRSLKIRELNINDDIKKANLKLQEYRALLSDLLTQGEQHSEQTKALATKNSKQLILELQKIQDALTDILTSVGDLSSGSFSLNGEVSVGLLLKCGETISIVFSNNKFLVNLFNKKQELSTDQLIELLKVIYKQ